MKIAILGDLHIGARNSNPVLFRMMKDFFSGMFFPYVKENGIKHVLQLGDVHDRRKSIDFVVADWISSEFFKWFEDNEVDFTTLVGNHDSYYKNTIAVDGMSQLAKRMKHVKVVKTPELLELGGKKFLMLPWICDSNREDCAKAAERYADADTFLLGHFELAGFEMIRGLKSETDCLDRDIVRKYRQVFSGHYHLTSEKGSIVYVGTPYELNWNDYGDRKRFFVYDTEADVFEEVLTKCTVHEKIVVDGSVPLPKSFPSCRGKFVKVVVEGSVKPKDLEKALAAMSDSGAQTIQCIGTGEEKAGEETQVTLDALDNPAQMVAEDIAVKWKDDPDKLDLAKKLFKELLKKAEEAMQ